MAFTGGLTAVYYQILNSPGHPKLHKKHRHVCAWKPDYSSMIDKNSQKVWSIQFFFLTLHPAKSTKPEAYDSHRTQCPTATSNQLYCR